MLQKFSSGQKITIISASIGAIATITAGFFSFYSPKKNESPNGVVIGLEADELIQLLNSAKKNTKRSTIPPDTNTFNSIGLHPSDRAYIAAIMDGLRNISVMEQAGCSSRQSLTPPGNEKLNENYQPGDQILTTSYSFGQFSVTSFTFIKDWQLYTDFVELYYFDNSGQLIILRCNNSSLESIVGGPISISDLNNSLAEANIKIIKTLKTSLGDYEVTIEYKNLTVAGIGASD
jgi:hypothetical protein